MNREEYLAWCKNCKKKAFDLNKGVTCSLTKEIASFKEYCDSFEFDEKEFRKNVISDLLKMKESSNDYIEKPTKIHWKKYPNKKSLPIEIIIRNGNLLVFLIGLILMDLLLIIIVHFDEIKDLDISKSEFISMMKTIGLLIPMSVLGLLVVFSKMLDKEPKIIINDKGVRIENSELYSWNTTEFNVLFSQDDGQSTYSRYLILSPFNKKSIKYLINSLEYSPKKILHLIALYKEI
jgi:hypothetical protein